MKKRIITVILAIMLIFSTSLIGCEDGSTKSSSKSPEISSSSSSSSSVSMRNQLEAQESEDISYIDLSKNLSESEQQEVDSLFFKNDLTNDGADPSCIYDEASGNFYMYTTGLYARKSTDLIHWEKSSRVFTYAENTWVSGYQWAPAVIYDKDLGKYLMFYTGSVKSQYYAINSIPTGIETGNSFCVCMGISDSPEGPFVQWTGTVQGGTYQSGANFSSYEITGSHTFINFERMKYASPIYYPYEGFIKVIDVEPFIDPVTGDKYLYMCRDLNTDKNAGTQYPTSSIMVIKMIDWFTPDYSTVRLITECNFTNVGDSESTGGEGSVNEGPYVIYNEQNNKYYLTYSCNSYWNKTYQVRQAVSDSPMGPFTKIAVEKGGAVIATDANWPHRAGTGHHTFAKINGALYMVYHMHTTPDKEFKWPNSNRCIGIDKISWFKNEDGELVMTTNGPTMGYMLYSGNQQGYTNVADKAKVYAYDGGGKQMFSDNLSYINDNVVKTIANDGKKEFSIQFPENDRDDPTICLDFSSPVTVRGIQIFNSYSNRTAFDYVKDVSIFYYENEILKCKKLGELTFDWSTYCTSNLTESGTKVYAPGNYAGAIFNEISNVVSISVHLWPQINDKIYNSWDKITGIAVSEIAVIGKNA